MDKDYIRRRSKKTTRNYPLQQRPSQTICSKHPMNIWYSQTANQDFQGNQFSLSPEQEMLYNYQKHQGVKGNYGNYAVQSPAAGVWQPPPTGREAVLDNIYTQLGHIKQALNNVQSHPFASTYHQAPAGTMYQQYPGSHYMQGIYQKKPFSNRFQTRSRSSQRSFRNQLQITDPQNSFQRLRSRSAEPLRIKDLNFKRQMNRRASVTSFDSDTASLWRPSRRSYKNSTTKKLKDEKTKYMSLKPKEFQGYDKNLKKPHKKSQRVKNTRSSSPYQERELRSSLSKITASTKKTKNSEKKSSSTNLLLQLLEKMTEVLTKATKSETSKVRSIRSSSREGSYDSSKRIQSRDNSQKTISQVSSKLQNSSVSSKTKSYASKTKKFKNQRVAEERQTESVSIQLNEITRKLNHLKARPKLKDNQNRFEQVSSLLQSIKKDTKKPQPAARNNFLNFFGKKSKHGSASNHLKEESKNTEDLKFLPSKTPMYDRKSTVCSTTASPSSLKLEKIFTNKNTLVPSKITRKFKGKRKEVMAKKETMYYDLKQFLKSPVMAWEDPINSTPSSARSEAAFKKGMALTTEKTKQSSSKPTVSTNLSEIFSDRFNSFFSEKDNYDFRNSKNF